MRVQSPVPPLLTSDSLARRNGKASRDSFNRPPRVIQALPRDEVAIPVPPAPPADPPPLPVATIGLSLLTGLLYMLFATLRGGSPGSLWLSLPMFAIALISAGMAVATYLGQRRKREQQMSAYHTLCREVLAQTRTRLEGLERRQREILLGNDPDVRRLLQIVGIGSEPPQPLQVLWERRPGDPDFLALRLGLGNLPTSITIRTPEPNMFQTTPALNEALDLAQSFAIVRGVPLTVALPTHGSVALAGPRAQALPLALALLAQLVVHHAPNEVRLAALWPNTSNDWDWLWRLPHTAPLDGSSDHRLLARYDTRPEHLRQLLDELWRELQERAEQGFDPTRQPHIVVLLDAYHTHGADYALFAQIISNGRAFGIYAICLVDESGQVPGACGAYVDLGPGCDLVLAGAGGAYLPLTPDTVDPQTIQLLARQGLAPITMADAGGRRDIPRHVRLLELLGLNAIDHYQPEQFWNHLPVKSWHPVPLGKMAPETPLELDLNQDMHGAHGMIAGTTGSGKSELLLTLLAALAVRHSPDRVNFMLIDFKGAATFSELVALPHTVGVVSDLEGYVAERALIAINSELDRRKKLLAATQVADIHDYREKGLDQRHRPLPNLLIAIDEFDELARDYPDFVTELIRVGKQGRSLGVQLLFVTQQPSAIKDGLTGNLSYRIALRLTSVEDSRSMLGQPDAAYLTSETPGRGYFRVGKDVQPFQSARVRVPYRPPVSQHIPPTLDVTGRPELRTMAHANGTSLREGSASPKREEDATDLSELVKRMGAVHPTSYARERYPIWLPPLKVGLTLQALFQRTELAPMTQAAPFALLDLPAQASQAPLCFWLGGKSGHLLVVGASGAGKTTLLRSLILALALRYPPTHLWVYILDASGGGLGLSGSSGAQTVRLPHLADTVTFSQAARVERLLLELQRQLGQRRRLFAAHGVDSLADYIKLRAADDKQMPAPPPAILVVIDQVGDLSSLGAELVDGLKSVMRDGRAFGIAVAVSGSGRAEVGAYAALCETRIALRLNDPTDSEMLIGKSAAAKIRPDQPGRGFLRLGERLIELQVALPSLIATHDDDDDQRSQPQLNLDPLLREVQTRYAKLGGVSGLPQALPLLPLRIDLPELLPQQPAVGLRLPIAINNLTLEPLELDFTGATPHLLIAGPPGSGKHTLLQTILRGLAARYSPDAVRFLLVDGTDRRLEPMAALAPVQPIEGVRVVREEAEVKALAQFLEQESKNRRGTAEHKPQLVVVIHSWDTLHSSNKSELNKLAFIAQRGSERRIHFIVTTSKTPNDALLSVLLAERCVALLGAPPADGTSMGIRFPRSAIASELPPGRGFLMIQGQTNLVQFAIQMA